MKRSTFITWDQLKVGLLIVLAIAVLAIAAVRLGQAANLFTERYELVALLPNAGGLREGDERFVVAEAVFDEVVVADEARRLSADSSIPPRVACRSGSRRPTPRRCG